MGNGSWSWLQLEGCRSGLGGMGLGVIDGDQG